MDEVIKVELKRLWDESNTQSKRIEKLESEVNDLKKITVAVERLAIQMECLTKEMSKLSTDVEEIKNRPAQAWSNMTRTIFTTIISAIAGGMAVAMVQALSTVM